jgi:hypothetical protein
MFLRFIPLLLIPALLVSCGEELPKGSSDVAAETTSENTRNQESPGQYEYVGKELGKDCTTGKHFYRTRSELCKKLKSDSSNRYCAKDKRDEAYQQFCATRGGFENEFAPALPKSDVEVSILGNLDADFQLVKTTEADKNVTRWEGSFRVVQLGGSAQAGRNIQIAQLDLNPGTLQMIGLPGNMGLKDCGLKFAFSQIRNSTPVVRFALSVEDTAIQPGVCEERLLALRRGWSAKINRAVLLGGDQKRLTADVRLTLY